MNDNANMEHTRLFFITVFTFCLSLVMRAQTTPVATPVTSTEGYDFVATFLPNGSSAMDAPDLRLQFLVSSREENQVHVQCGFGYSKDYTVAAGTTEVIEIPGKNAYWDITKEKNQSETPINLGVHIYSKNGQKMTVYSVNQSGSKSLSLDGSQVLPMQALGHEYIVMCDSDETMATEFVVMSTQKNTRVNIQLPAGVTTSKGNSGSLPPITFTQPYMIYIVRVAVQQENPSSILDLSGTTICADKPVAVWSGNQAARITLSDQSASTDHAFDQLLPIDRWGTQFIAPMTGLQMRLNTLNIIAREPGTTVTLTSKSHPQGESKTLGAAGKWSRLVDAYDGQESNWTTLEDSTFFVTADKPIQVYIYSSSSLYNIDQNIRYHGDPSMTMIAPLEHLTDTAIFSTYKNPIAFIGKEEDMTIDDVKPLKYELVVWAKNSTISSLKRNGNAVSASLFKAVPGTNDYKFARIPISSAEEGYQILTAAEKGFGGYVCGIENGQACLYPIGYDFLPAQDSLFLSKKSEETKEVRGGEFNAKYPDKANGGGWYLDKVDLPNQPTQYDTILICDSTKLRFPVILHNEWTEMKWEIMRLNPSTHKPDSVYKKTTAQERDSSINLSNPFYETRFFVLPEKDKKADKRHPFEDFEVRAILFREPILCSDLKQEDWPKDTLSTIVRVYRSYNDTTWLIKCTNDKDLTEKNGKYEYEYFGIPGSQNKEKITLSVGENLNITRKYTTVNGCENDSIVTLCVLLCQSEVEKRNPDYLCEEELKGINSQFGEFFQTFDFYGTLQNCKKNNNASANGWSWKADKLHWVYTGTDIIRTVDCTAQMDEWHEKYGAAYPRATPGCDKSLTIELHVLPITTYGDTATTCQNSYEWKYYENRGYNPKPKTETIKKSDYGNGTYEVVRYYKPNGNPPQGFDHLCDREKYVLVITFLNNGETRPKKISLCSDDAPLVVSKASDPDIIDATYKWTFDPKDHEPGKTYKSDRIECATADKGCPYYLQYEITVNDVEIHYDTVVYCYEDGSQVLHTWSGHPYFWANEKGKSTKTRYNDATKPFYINRPKADKTKDTRIVYELTDTITNIIGQKCHIIYNQTVILLPPYNTSEQRTPISTKQWFEWHDVIWAGEKVNTDTITNPQGKTVYVLKEYGRAPEPEGWEVSYTAGNYTYALTTTTMTHTYLHDDKSRTEPCDSTVQLLVQIADEQEEHLYTWTCNDGPFEWKAGDTTIYIDMTDYQDPRLLPKSIQREEHRKTKKPYWPVEGIGAHFYLDLTIYPSYLTTVDSAACQEPGKSVVFKDLTFSLNEPGMQEKSNKFETEHQIWTNPETHKEEEVWCDSGEVVRMYVRPIYREDVNRALSTYEYTLYSHDTVRFFTEPVVLLVGKDFFTTHPEVSGIDELKTIAGVDSVLIIDETLVPQFAAAEATKGELHLTQVSSGTALQACDSTTFLDMIVRKATILPPVIFGDNGNRLDGVSTPWKFGGDTSIARPADGTRYNTFPQITSDYFRFYYDEHGNVVGEVDYTDGYDRAKNKDYHCNEDGTRTYLLIDTILNQDGTLDVQVQYVTVYPTFLVTDNKDEVITVCATDSYLWPGHFNDQPFLVSDYTLWDRHAYIRDTMCAKRYHTAAYNYICVDSICILDLTVLGNGEVKRNYSRCFNDPKWAPEWANASSAICYDVNGSLSETITNEIPHPDPNVQCKDLYVGIIKFQPAYGVAPCTGMNAYYRDTYIDPYNYDTTICQHDDEFHWLLKNGGEHIPSNLYLYEYKTGNPDLTHFTDAQGNPTNKVPGNRIPSDLAIGNYTVRDSLKTVGCYCDSVLTLNYELREALEPVELRDTICQGETYQLGDTVLTTEGTYTQFIKEKEEDQCKTRTTVKLSVVKASSFTVEPSPVCFGDADTELTYAISYKYKGKYPTSFSVYYDEGAKDLGFKDIIDQKIERLESEWKVDSVYVLDLPIPMLDSKEEYPEPGVYSATIGFKNGVCAGEELMTYTFEVMINYPGWIMEQRHNDLIVLLNAEHNGGYEWTNFQWYRNGQKMFGYTKPYLYVPEGLVYESEGSASYHVVLTETDENGEVISSAPTCPIIVQYMPTNPDADHGPSSDYIAVTPTCVPRGGSIHILALNENSSGEYRITTAEGQFVSRGEYHGAATPVSIPSVEGLYIVQVWSDNKESKESYRAIKVIVRDTCPNCDKSSF